jgi:hypothetical protein
MDTSVVPMSNTIQIRKGIDPSFVPNIVDSDYRKATGLSKSMLSHFLKSPAHYLAHCDQMSEPTAAMQFGTAYDAEILQQKPSDFYAVMPDVDGRTKEGKAVKEQFKIDAAGKAVISPKEAEMIPLMKKALYEHPVANRLLRTLTHKQVACFGTYQDSKDKQVRLKGLLDGYNEAEGIIVDLKTAEDASPEGFRKAIWKYKYAYQDIQYRWLLTNAGKPVNDFIFIVQEKEPPFAVGCYSISVDDLALTYQSWEMAMIRFGHCQKSGQYPAYADEVVNLKLTK